MDPREKNKFNPFYLYFKRLDGKLQLKLEKYFINPFLTEGEFEEHRTKMLNQYMTIKGDDYVHYNNYLPQQRVHITIHVYFFVNYSA
ncbi:unnamed protein product [Meloidogyne enterolobii]|uniref:Uncharacterized protein n=1 Tax=Meloidogyne enterolobii TaxID=390850 RepID=A0ACB0XXA3_MELEN